MIRGAKNNRAADDIRAQVILGRDGRPAFALLPLEVFATLLVYAHQGRAGTPGKAAAARAHDWLREDRLSAAASFLGEWGGGKTSSLRKHFRSMLSDERMEKTFKDVSDWLAGSSITALAGTETIDDAEDIAAYDAAKARNEECFPLEIADRLIGGENPIKVFREHRRLTQAQLAREADTTAPYVSQLETGRRMGSTKLLHRVAEALGVGLDDLV